MSRSRLAVEDAGVHLVGDGHYLEVVTGLARAARERLWCSVFIVELNASIDPEVRVPGLLSELAAARWRGVDVRLVVGGSRSNLEIAELAITALEIARRMRIPARCVQSRRMRGSHVKLVVADDLVLTGSHNWSPNAFTTETQDSILVRSPALAACLAEAFLAQWARGASGGIR